MVILKKRDGTYQGIQVPSTHLISRAARDLLSLELAAPKKSLANGVFDWIVFYFWLYWPDGSNSANPWPRCGRQQ